MSQPNDLILRMTTSVIAFMLLGFAIYLLFAGHNMPGGGFVGGLVTAGAFVLLNMTYGKETIKKFIPIRFQLLIPIGLSVALLTGLASFVFNKPYLTHAFTTITIPVLGEIDLATAAIFDIGVYLVVLGATITIIMHVNEKQID